ncbi:hypothetical protein EDB83DRAFT_2363401, partial [Lactarius deliciosus]
TSSSAAIRKAWSSRSSSLRTSSTRSRPCQYPDCPTSTCRCAANLPESPTAQAHSCTSMSAKKVKKYGPTHFPLVRVHGGPRAARQLELHHVEPAAALASWWSRIRVIPGILATAGKCEGLFDQILDAGTDIGQYVKDTTAAVEPGGIREDEDVTYWI